MPMKGQGIALDPADRGLLYGIDRAKRESWSPVSAAADRQSIGSIARDCRISISRGWIPPTSQRGSTPFDGLSLFRQVMTATDQCRA